jgi:uncharacterized DUF497 family protein
MRTPKEEADFELLCRLVDRIRGRLVHGAFASFTETERTLWTVWWLEAEVNNGGFDQNPDRLVTWPMSPAERILYVVTTERGLRTRNVSARRASTHERRIYGSSP